MVYRALARPFPSLEGHIQRRFKPSPIIGHKVTHKFPLAGLNDVDEPGANLLTTYEEQLPTMIGGITAIEAQSLRHALGFILGSLLRS